MMKYKYETHMHTAEISACAISSAAEQAREYKARGYSGIIVTDHFVNGNSACPRDLPWKEKMEYFHKGYERAKREGDRIGLDVFFGWEYSIRGSDFLTYGLDLAFLIANPAVEHMEIEQYSAFVRKHGGYLAQAHPFRKAWYIENPYPADATLLDGVEVFNAGMPDDVNAKARALAEKHNLAMQAGSDSHASDMPFASGIIMEKKAKDIFGVIDAIRGRKVELILPGK